MDAATLKQLAQGFEAHRVVVAKAIRHIQEQFPDVFVDGTAEVLRESDETPGAKFLLSTLLARPDALNILCDPRRFSTAKSARLLRHAKAIDPLVGVKLAKLAVSHAPYEGPRADFAVQALDVLDQTGEVATVLPALRGLLECKHSRIRAKVALLMGRETRNPQLADMEDSDDGQTRASAIEALWGLTTSAAKDAFRRAIRDSRHRVAASGAVALFIAGDPEGMSAILEFSRDGRSEFRAAAAWAMGQAANARFLPALCRLVKDPDVTLRGCAVKAMVATRTRMKTLREMGTVSVQILKAVRQESECVVDVYVGEVDAPVRGLDFRNFVVWSGEQMVESISVEEKSSPKCCQYRIVFQVANDTRNMVRVEVYTDGGIGGAQMMESVPAEEMAVGPDEG